LEPSSWADVVEPGTSALFVLLRKVQPDKVLAEMGGFRGRVIRSSLSPDQEKRLQEALGHPAFCQGRPLQRDTGP
jgi:uncharacterized membrane protein